MRNDLNVAVVIPAVNEERSIEKVVSAIPKWVDDVVVVDNASTDSTADVARGAGARVVFESRRGYGSACQAGIHALNDPDVVVFLDADLSDFPEEMDKLVEPILSDEADMVIGSRVLGEREPGALTPQARFGNWLACSLIRFLWGVSYTDLGPFRAIRYSALEGLDMCDRDYGWTVEMQIRAVLQKLKILEVPVRYRKRIGKSKISGTLKGVIGAGTKILGVIFLFGVDSILSKRRKIRGGQTLAIFTRYPQAGKTKTRLIPTLGEEGAADLQRRMTFHTLQQARKWSDGKLNAITVFTHGGDKNSFSGWLGRDLVYVQQAGENLGQRMLEAFRASFQRGAERVVIIGTDCPGITKDHLKRAFREITQNTVVLGPARDGGYYLIGCGRVIPELFQNIPWGTSGVLNDTVYRAFHMGLSVHLLGLLDDVDRPEDLGVWNRICSEKPVEPKISVIVPALNEAGNIERCISSIRSGENIEIIVVDGESCDGTVDIALSLGVTVVESLPGRGCQMNVGAEHASGDVYVFLHADTFLPEYYDWHIRAALCDSEILGGAFEFSVDEPSWSLRLIERMVCWRSRVFDFPYGDQGIVVRRECFEEIGGFSEMPLMEDYEFVLRLRKRGGVGIIPLPVVTSARRWYEVGVWRTTLLNQVCVIAYRLGISPERIVRWYGRHHPAPTRVDGTHSHGLRITVRNLF